MTIYPSDTDNDESKKPLRLNLVTIFSKNVITFVHYTLYGRYFHLILYSKYFLVPE